MSKIVHIPKSQLHASAGFNTFHVPELRSQSDERTVVLDRSQLSTAAEALREVEVVAQEPAPSTTNVRVDALESLNIDELRAVAKELDVPDREKIIEKDELVAAIRRIL